MTTYYKFRDTVTEERFIQRADPDRWTPVVVIDPEDREQVERLLRAYYRTDSDIPTRQGIDNFQAVLREFANPKPDEPTGLGALVRDDEGDLWQRDNLDDRYRWQRITRAVGGKSTRDKWEHIVAVEVLFAGVTEDES